MTPQQTYDVARGAGFPPETARQMVAIAQRESSLNPNVVGTLNADKETSYGLWQINLKDKGIRTLMAANGITADNIRVPENNARAAFLLWGGDDANLRRAWYIDRFGNQYGYAEKYTANLARLPGVGVMESQYSGLPVFDAGVFVAVVPSPAGEFRIDPDQSGSGSGSGGFEESEAAAGRPPDGLIIGGALVFLAVAVSQVMDS